MGNRRRKLLRRKFQALPWNVYGKKSKTNTTQPEQKIVKVVEDNSVMIDRMKRMSETFDELVIAMNEVDWDEVEEVEEEKSVVQMKAEPLVSMRTEPTVEMKEEPSVEMTIQPFNEPTLIAPKKTLNFKKMTKRNLLSYAKENNIAVRSTMTKTQIIKAINKS